MSAMDSQIIDQAVSCKEAGNEHFKRKEYEDAVKCYTSALSQCPQDHEYRVVFLKNRAACYLKIQQYSLALSDCTQVLAIAPNDVKALYRRAMAYQAAGNLTDAFTDIKLLLSVDPRNKEATELARNLTIAIKKRHDTLQSTEGMIKEVFEALLNPDVPKAKLVLAAKNCAILSQESAGAEKLYQAEALDILLPYVDSELPEVVRHILGAYAGLCVDHKERAQLVLKKFTPEKFSSLIAHKCSEVSCNAIAVIKQILVSISSENAESSTETSSLVDVVFSLLLDHSVTSSARDYIMEMLISTIPKVITLFLLRSTNFMYAVLIEFFHNISVPELWISLNFTPFLYPPFQRRLQR